jgi:hypothetical protein
VFGRVLPGLRARIVSLADAPKRYPETAIGKRAAAGDAATTLGHWTGGHLATRGGNPGNTRNPAPTYGDLSYYATARQALIGANIAQLATCNRHTTFSIARRARGLSRARPPPPPAGSAAADATGDLGGGPEDEEEADLRGEALDGLHASGRRSDVARLMKSCVAVAATVIPPAVTRENVSIAAIVVVGAVG